jgi:hypothetical protein
VVPFWERCYDQERFFPRGSPVRTMNGLFAVCLAWLRAPAARAGLYLYACSPECAEARFISCEGSRRASSAGTIPPIP